MVESSDKDILEYILLLMEEPDDGWVEEVSESGDVELTHRPTGKVIRISRGS